MYFTRQTAKKSVKFFRFFLLQWKCQQDFRYRIEWVDCNINLIVKRQDCACLKSIEVIIKNCFKIYFGITLAREFGVDEDFSVNLKTVIFNIRQNVKPFYWWDGHNGGWGY